MGRIENLSLSHRFQICDSYFSGHLTVPWGHLGQGRFLLRRLVSRVHFWQQLRLGPEYAAPYPK
jgi:hypothetical protein